MSPRPLYDKIVILCFDDLTEEDKEEMCKTENGSIQVFSLPIAVEPNYQLISFLGCIILTYSWASFRYAATRIRTETPMALPPKSSVSTSFTMAASSTHIVIKFMLFCQENQCTHLRLFYKGSMHLRKGIADSPKDQH